MSTTLEQCANVKVSSASQAAPVWDSDFSNFCCKRGRLSSSTTTWATQPGAVELAQRLSGMVWCLLTLLCRPLVNLQIGPRQLDAGPPSRRGTAVVRLSPLQILMAVLVLARPCMRDQLQGCYLRDCYLCTEFQWSHPHCMWSHQSHQPPGPLFPTVLASSLAGLAAPMHLVVTWLTTTAACCFIGAYCVQHHRPRLDRPFYTSLRFSVVVEKLLKLLRTPCASHSMSSDWSSGNFESGKPWRLQIDKLWPQLGFNTPCS